MESEDQPDPIAERDQAFKEMAARLGSYFAELIDQGFGREEAMTLVRDYSDKFLDASFDTDD